MVVSLSCCCSKDLYVFLNSHFGAPIIFCFSSSEIITGMEAIRGQNGIQLLLAAEQDAQQIVNTARNGKPVSCFLFIITLQNLRCLYFFLHSVVLTTLYLQETSSWPKIMFSVSCIFTKQHGCRVL